MWKAITDSLKIGSYYGCKVCDGLYDDQHSNSTATSNTSNSKYKSILVYLYLNSLAKALHQNNYLKNDYVLVNIIIT